MNASPINENACGSCGEPLVRGARFCPNCGARVGDLPPVESLPGAFTSEHAERQWLGIPARFVLLCVGFAALGAAIGLFATGTWAWGIVALVFAVVVLGALAEATRRGGAWTEQSQRLAADRRAQAATAAEVWRARLDTTVTRWRTRSKLDAVELDRASALQALGEAAWQGDAAAEQTARQRLVELEQERQQIEQEHAERLAGAEERIRRARLPVEDTVMLASKSAGSVGGEATGAQREDRAPEGARGQHAPYPPPDEGNPPEPAQVPEPYPPPDEGTPPAPEPDPGEAGDGEPDTGAGESGDTESGGRESE